MRIGIDCRLWNESGVGRYVRNLVEQLQILDRNNDYVLFIRGKDRDEILKRAQNDNFRIVNADVRWHTLEEQIKFPQILNKEKLDLVHFPYFSVPIFYNRPFVVTIHDLILHHFPTGLASTIPRYLYKLKLFGYRFVIKRAAQDAKKIITVSNATKSEIIDHLKVDSSKVVVTYEGAFSNSKLKSQKSKPQLKAQNYFLYVGNAYPHKNLDRLLEAFSLLCHLEGTKRLRDPMGISLRLSPDRNDIRLVLVGKEDYFYKRLKEKVKKINLEKSVLFYGEVSDEELAGLYKNALALVMPALMEGLGLPGLEAMANKCLVLSSNIPSLREVYSDVAIYFDPYNPKDIAEKLRKVCFNDLNHFSQKIEKGLERVKLFSWGKMAKETLLVYESCFAY